jgi:hypothetical protein
MNLVVIPRGRSEKIARPEIGEQIANSLAQARASWRGPPDLVLEFSDRQDPKKPNDALDGRRARQIADDAVFPRAPRILSFGELAPLLVVPCVIQFFSLSCEMDATEPDILQHPAMDAANRISAFGAAPDCERLAGAQQTLAAFLVLGAANHLILYVEHAGSEPWIGQPRPARLSCYYAYRRATPESRRDRLTIVAAAVRAGHAETLPGMARPAHPERHIAV